MDSLAEAARLLSTARNVAVITHIRPDGDAIGAATAVVYLLRRLGITAHAYVGQHDPIAENLLSIPGASQIRLGEELADATLIVAVDCGDLHRTGSYADAITHLPLINIDHHSSNPGYGTVNVVDPTAESTTVVVRRLAAALGVPLDPTLAQCLYAGLLTDTGSFRWGTPTMHTVAAELVAAGANPRSIARQLLGAVPFADMAVIAEVLAAMSFTRIEGLGVASAVVDHRLVSKGSRQLPEIITGWVSGIAEADVAVIFKENQPDVWNVSLRSADEERCDVSRIAHGLGGGGHRAAAAFRMRAQLPAVRAALLEAMSHYATQ